MHKKVDKAERSFVDLESGNRIIIRVFIQVESLHRGIVKEGEAEAVRMAEVEAELEEIERKMTDLEKDREDRSKRIMDRRVLQVTTLQELGKTEYFVIN